jgi:hypothetical protein
MTFPLAYPLGGSRAEGRVLYERELLRIVPPWLRRTVGGAIMKALGMCVDSLIDRAVAGVALRFPNSDADALAIMGRERRIVRGPVESADAYALRVQGWLDAHQRRGGVYALLRQWHAYNVGDRRLITVVYQSGTTYRLYASGDILRANEAWDVPPDAGWARAWCLVSYASDPTPISAAQDAQIMSVPRLWSAAHMAPLRVYVVWPGARLWGYPAPPLTWDQQAALYTWDDVIPHEVT